MEWQGATRRQQELTLRVEKPARGLVPATTKNVECASTLTTTKPKQQVDKSMMKPLTPPTHTQSVQGRRGQWVHRTTQPTSSLKSKKVVG